MTRYERVTRGLRGMRTWFDLNLEQDPDNDYYRNGKSLCTDALELLQAQKIALLCYTQEEEDEE